MGNSRKYNLELTTSYSKGLGTYVINSAQHSLLEAFDTHDAQYSQILTCDLQKLSNLEYNYRVSDFLESTNVEHNQRPQLLSGATIINDPLCNVFCYLNPNFLVYIFLTGVRIIDAGKANGVIQYLVSGDTYNSGWQSSPTFLNLDPNGVYTIAIRDYVDGNATNTKSAINPNPTYESYVACEYSRIVSIALLIPSTTAQPIEKMVRLMPTYVIDNEIVNSIGDAPYSLSVNNGDIVVNPPLIQGEGIILGYSLNATAWGGVAKISCYHCGQYTENYDLAEFGFNLPKQGTIPLCFGDTISYGVNACETVYGTNTSASLSLTTVESFGNITIAPAIDFSTTPINVSASLSTINVNVDLKRCYYNEPSAYSRNVIGTIDFTPNIPTNQHIDVTVLAQTNNISGGGWSCIDFYCNGFMLFQDHIDNTMPLQPQSITLYNIKASDTLCYNINLNAPNLGDNPFASLCISNLTSSVGIIPNKDTVFNCDNISLINEPIPIEVSLCNQNRTDYNSNGFINTNIPMVAPLCGQFTFSSNPPNCLGGIASLVVECKPFNFNAFLDKCLICTANSIYVDFSWNPGDIICYSMSKGVITDSTIFCLQTISSPSGEQIPSINPQKGYDYVGTIGGNNIV